MFTAYEEGLLRFKRVGLDGKLEHVDDYRWNTDELGNCVGFTTREKSSHMFMFFDSFTLQCIQIVEGNKLKLKWTSKVSFKNPNTMKEEEFKCLVMNFLERQKILLLGAMENQIIAYNIETGTKIGDYLASGSSANNDVAIIAASDKHSCFITSSTSLD